MKLTNPNHSYPNKKSGFTIIEVLVMVIIIFILAAIVFPRFVDFEDFTRQATVKENMKIVQKAAQDYAAANGGDYPAAPDDPTFKCFFPGGNGNRLKPQGGNYPENPYTHNSEAPLLGKVADVKVIRQLPPGDLGGSRMAGKLFYNALAMIGQTKTIGYAIQGADKNGHAFAATPPNLTHVLSNL